MPSFSGLVSTSSKEIIMDSSAPLSEEELVELAELQAQIKRKLAIVLADPKTPETFKDAFMNNGEKA